MTDTKKYVKILYSAIINLFPSKKSTRQRNKKFLSLKRKFKMSHKKSEDSSSSCHSKEECVVDDKLAKHVERLWKKYFPDASLLPVIGLPSNSGGVATLTHTMGDGHLMSINGLVSKSALANNALYSFECAEPVKHSKHNDRECGKFLNLYEIMIPELPGKNGEDSTSQYYVKLLSRYGLSVAGVHFHWWGQNVIKGNTLVAAVHHQGIDISPLEFSKRTIKALLKTIKLIEERSHDKRDKHHDHCHSESSEH